VGQSDAAKYPPSTGAINSGRLLETRIQGRKTGEKEHRVGADHREDERDAKRDERLGLVAQHVRAE